MKLSITAFLIGLLALNLPAQAADPSALWKIVHDRCVPNLKDHGDPKPCALVDVTGGEDKGYAVLKDLVGIAQFLLIPTARNSGIDDPHSLNAGITNYWDHAWQARRFTEARLGAALPRDAVSLAINSSVGRSQDQFHIHIDCIRPDVRDAIRVHANDVKTEWKPFPIRLSGHPYRAIRIERETLDGVDPFRLLVDKDPQTAANIGLHTLVVAGAMWGKQSGFIVFDDVANRLAGDFASGEELQDHDCKIAR